jgi:type I restriction enzyme R subunit
VLKITGAADKPLQLIRRYKNERNPNVAVTVDLLTTGIDVPEICNLVFLRRVAAASSTSRCSAAPPACCDDIGKEVFRIFDAVDLYAASSDVTSMKPVVVDPKPSTFATARQELQGAARRGQRASWSSTSSSPSWAAQAAPPQGRAAAERLRGRRRHDPAELLSAARAAPLAAVAWFAAHPGGRRAPRPLDRRHAT